MFQTPEILARAVTWLHAVARFGPVLPVALIFALAVVEALVLPRRLWAKAVWLLVALAWGTAAEGLVYWQRQASDGVTADRLAAETGALRGLWSQWDALSRRLPPPAQQAPADSFDTVDDALAALSAKTAAIDGQVARLKAGEKTRSVDEETAQKLADYLRQFGSYRVVVSCPPKDLEAFTYANQLVNILRAAGWDANGPEATVYPNDGAAMGVTLAVRDPGAPEAAKILVDAFSRFNIPYQSGIAENEAIPDTATVELYVAKKP